MTERTPVLLFCDAATIAPDGKITLYGLFDIIGCSRIPARHPQFTVYWKLYIGPESSGSLFIRINKPDGSTLLDSQPFDLGKNPLGKHQGFFTFGGIEFPAAGEYRAVLVLNENEVGSAILTIQDAGPIH